MKVTKDELAQVARETLERACVKLSDRFSRTAEKFHSGIRDTSGGATIIALRGELGVGKTTFTQALARELGITDAVQSPTYVLMKSYPINFKGFKHFIHIDAYRLDKPEEFATLKPETFLHNPENLIVIEWPERVGGHLPAPDILLNFSHADADHERYIEVI